MVKKICFLLLVKFFAVVHLFAAKERFTVYLNASDILIGDSVVVKDDKFLDEYGLFNTDWQDDFHLKRTLNFVGLFLNPATEMPSASFEVNVDLKISWTDKANDEFEDNVSLSVGYNPDGSSAYPRHQYFHFEDGHIVKAEILQYNVSGISLQQLDDLVFLENTIEVERYYKLSDQAPDLNTNLDAESGEILVSWNFTEGAEKYELEWTFVNSYDGSGGEQSGLEYDFNRNSRRVVLSDLSYRIPLTFERGWVVARVRGIGSDKDFNPTYGPWSLNANSGSVGPTSGSWAFRVRGDRVHMQDNLNWHYSASYAEEGKRHATLTYFDGLLNQRQQLTRMNTSRDVLVTEIYYDHQGRQALVSLPAPVNESAVGGGVSLSFQPAFNRNLQGEAYGPEDFDSQTDCGNTAAPMHSSYGAGLYYSAQNNHQDEFNAFIPEAGGYPFIHTEYTPDQTGKISRVGKAGAAHQLDGGNESKYFYGVPSQQELDYLLGSDAGGAEFYRKNMVVDENGQVTVSYLNSRNRVVATALAGESPEALDALPSQDVQMEMNLLQSQNDNSLGMSKTAAVSFTVPDHNINHHFRYNLLPENFTEAYCDQFNFCLDCVYDLTVTLINNECGTEIHRHSTRIGSISDITLNCTGGQQLVYDFQETLAMGSYTISRVLTVNEEAANRYVQLYMQSDPCLDLHWETILLENRERIDKLDCLLDCETFEIQDTYEVEVDGQIEIVSFSDDEIARMKEAQEAICGVSISYCESMYLTLQADVSPGGQYALFMDTVHHVINPSLYAESVLNAELAGLYASLPGAQALNNPVIAGLLSRNWRNPVGGYKEEDGSDSYVEVHPGTAEGPAFPDNLAVEIDGRWFVRPENLEDVRDFIDAWQPSWAEALVPYHPEYCYYQFCMEHEDSYDFDMLILETTSYALASEADMLDLFAADPYFNNPSDPVYQQMQDKLEEYYLDEYGNSYSIEDLVVAASQCNQVDFTLNDFLACIAINNFGGNPATLNQEWELYKMLYYAAKNELLAEVRHQFALECGGYNGCIGVGEGQLFDRRLFNYVFPQISAGCVECIYQQNCVIFSQLFRDKTKRFPDASDLYDMLGVSMTGDLLADLETGSAWAENTMNDMCSKCPMESALEVMLLKLAQEGELTSNAAISGGGYITPALHTELGGSGYMWEGKDEGNRLTAVMAMEGQSDCQLSLHNLMDEPIHWKDIVYFSCLEATGSSDHFAEMAGSTFRVRAVTARQEVFWLEGIVSCLDLDKCDITPFCSPSDAGKELLQLFNMVFYDRLTLNPSAPLPLSGLFVSNVVGNAIKEYFPESVTIPQFTWDAAASAEGRVLNASLRNGKTSCNFYFQITDGDYDFYQPFEITGIIPVSDKYKDEDCIRREAILIARAKDGSTFRINVTSNCVDMLDCCGTASQKEDCPEQLSHGRFESSTGFRSALKYSDLELRSGTYTLFSREQIEKYLSRISKKEDGTYKTEEPSSDEDKADAYGEINLLDLKIADTSFQNLELSESLQTEITESSIKQISFSRLDRYSLSTSEVEKDTSQLEMQDYREALRLRLEGFEADMQKIEEGTLDPESAYLSGKRLSLFDMPEERWLSFIPDQIDNLPVWITELDVVQGSEYVISGELRYYTHHEEVHEFPHASHNIRLAVNGVIIEPEVQQLRRPGLYTFKVYWYAAGHSKAEIELLYTDKDQGKDLLVSLGRLSVKETRCNELYCCPPVVPLPELDDTPCEDLQNTVAETNARNIFLRFVDDRRRNIREDYIAACLEAAEEFTLEYSSPLYHFTLFYYDQAGNLVKTIPPAGVAPLNPSQRNSMKQYREGVAQAAIYPEHQMATTYTYNSLNQLTKKNSPDAGTERMWYDPLGRVVLSQSARQQNPGNTSQQYYSYVIYDALNRIIEAGEVMGGDFNPAVAANQNTFRNWVNSGTRTEVVRTHYDVPFNVQVDGRFPGGQQNLRNNVASILYYEQGGSAQNYTNAVHFSYDLQGNLVRMIQEDPALQPYGLDVRMISYEYDKASGQVTRINYQEDQADQFFHRYEYDADNRLMNVYTSTDGFVWDNDAAYFYYRHGPLARKELGEERVQGIDYAYTINGWLKAVNSTSLEAAYDMGGDGRAAGIHQHIPADVFGFTLHYYEGDYQAIDNSTGAVASLQGSGLADGTQNLYNGMISHSTTALGVFQDQKVRAAAFSYDQLYRLTGVDHFTNFNAAANSWQAGGPSDDYRERFSYDSNSNFTALSRHGAAAAGPLEMDELNYHYYPQTNRLEYITDVVPVGNYDVDIDNQQPGNYAYDLSGNMTSDRMAGINLIVWNSRGKVDRVQKDDGSVVQFLYNGLGHRIAKVYGETLTYYVRDLQGRILSTYTVEENAVNWETVPIYGDSRLGMYVPDMLLDASEESSPLLTLKRGEKRYELTNHLGNVMAVVSDRKITDPASDMMLQADVLSASDYYAYGMQMPGRQYESDYIFGFNGMERDDELKGDGASYDFHARLYDPRVGQWLSVDPLMHKFPDVSPYLAFAGNPVNFIDPDGREPIEVDDDDVMVFTVQEAEAALRDDNEMFFSPEDVIWDDEVSNLNEGRTALDQAEELNTYIAAYETYQLAGEARVSAGERQNINRIRSEQSSANQRLDSRQMRAMWGQEEIRMDQLREVADERTQVNSQANQQVRSVRANASARRQVVRRIPLVGAGITTASMVNNISQDAQAWDRGDINAGQYALRATGRIIGGVGAIAIPFFDDGVNHLVDKIE